MSTSISQDQPNPWFWIENLTSVPTRFSDLLSTYSHIPEHEQIAHIKLLRDTAYARYPYPCLGRFRFLDLDLTLHPLYDTILQQLTKTVPPESNPPVFLDLGCCIGQDLRKLILDGVPPTRLYGADLRAEFVDIGFQLFRDEDKFPRDHFFAPANALEEEGADDVFGAVEGRVSVLHVSAVFHLFDREQQQKLARRCLKFLNHGLKKCLILGADTAAMQAGEVARADGSPRFRNSSDSWRALWEEIAKDEGVTVEVSHEIEELTKTDRAAGQLTKSDAASIVEDGTKWSRWWVWVEFREL